MTTALERSSHIQDALSYAPALRIARNGAVVAHAAMVSVHSASASEHAHACLCPCPGVLLAEQQNCLPCDESECCHLVRLLHRSMLVQ